MSTANILFVVACFAVTVYYAAKGGTEKALKEHDARRRQELDDAD